MPEIERKLNEMGYQLPPVRTTLAGNFVPAYCSGVLKRGGSSASFHVRPESVERYTVGPRWPVFTPAKIVPAPRGSCTTWCTWQPKNQA